VTAPVVRRANYRRDAYNASWWTHKNADALTRGIDIGDRCFICKKNIIFCGIAHDYYAINLCFFYFVVARSVGNDEENSMRRWIFSQNTNMTQLSLMEYIHVA
jgi:hypothetical protein